MKTDGTVCISGTIFSISSLMLTLTISACAPGPSAGPLPFPPEKRTITSPVPEKEQTFPSVISALVEKLRTLPEKRIAVLSFSGPLEKECPIGDYLADNLSTILTRYPEFTIVERTQVSAVLKEQKFSISGLIDESSAPQAGKLLGVNVVLLGKYYKLKNGLEIIVKAVNVETGAIITAQKLQTGESILTRLGCAAPVPSATKMKPSWSTPPRPKLLITQRKGVIRTCPSIRCRVAGAFERGVRVVPLAREGRWVKIFIPSLRTAGWTRILNIKIPQEGASGLHK